MVASVEVLEHIENDEKAIQAMYAATNKYVFALVPFGDDSANSNASLRARVLEQHEYFRVGYNENRIRKIFPEILEIRGCYWKNLGGLHRATLQDMSDESIKASLDELHLGAQNDIADEIPKIYPEALGIWVLADAR